MLSTQGGAPPSSSYDSAQSVPLKAFRLGWLRLAECRLKRHRRETAGAGQSHLEPPATLQGVGVYDDTYEFKRTTAVLRPGVTEFGVRLRARENAAGWAFDVAWVLWKSP